MIQQKNQRVGVFVDVQNLYHSAKNIYNARVNFKKLLKKLVGNRVLVRAVAYVVKSETALGEKDFFEALKKAGYELRVKDLQTFPGGAKKADWDVGMAVDAIRISRTLDSVIIVTGDGDFIPLVEYLKWGLGKQVEVGAFTKTASSDLIESADRFLKIEKFSKLLMNIPKKGKKK